MTATRTRNTVTVRGLAQLLQQYGITGDWAESPPPEPSERWADCEACGAHPCTPAQAATVAALFDDLRAANAPAPFACYPHCWGEIIIEWDTNGCRVVVTLCPRGGASVIVVTRHAPTCFFDLEGVKQ